LHNNDKVDASTGDLQNPEMITFYDLTKDGMDVVDKMCAAFSGARNTRRWPVVIFYSILNVAEISAFIFFLNKNRKRLRRILQKVLSLELFKKQLTIRATTSCLLQEVEEKAATFTVQLVPKEKPAQVKGGRCQECVRKDRETQYYC
jgi:hypothetical protein